MTDFTKPSDETLKEAQEVVELTSSDERLDSETQCTNAGLDPEVINAAVNLTLARVTPQQSLMLALDPGIGIMLGVTIAAAYINNKQ